MALFSAKPKPPAIDRILRDYAEQLAAVVAALAAGDPHADLKLAAMLESEPYQVRVAIVEKMRELLAARDEEKVQALDQIIQQQRLLEKQQKQQVMQQWLAYFMSQETLRKLRESFLAMPGLEHQVKHIGQELAKKGVLQNVQLGNKQDLGELTATLQHQQRQTGRDQGQGR